MIYLERTRDLIASPLVFTIGNILPANGMQHSFTMDISLTGESLPAVTLTPTLSPYTIEIYLSLDQYLSYNDVNLNYKLSKCVAGDLCKELTEETPLKLKEYYEGKGKGKLKHTPLIIYIRFLLIP